MAFAIIFESVGVGEWFVLLAVILVVVGPKRLPSTARKVGQYYSKFRRAAEGFKRQLLDMDTEMNRAIDESMREVDESVRDVEQACELPPEAMENPTEPTPMENPTEPTPTENPTENPVENSPDGH